MKFRRRLTAAGIVLLVMLFLGFFFAFRSTAESKDMNRRAAYAQEVLGVIARCHFEWMRLTYEAWTLEATRNSDFTGKYQEAREKLEQDLSRLQALTADNPEQRKLVAKLLELIDEGIPQLRGGPAPKATWLGKRFDWTVANSQAERAQRLFDALEANERILLAQRSDAVRSNVARTRLVLLITGALTFSILIVSGHLIQREILMRARIEAGMRKAQELLGGNYEAKRAELGHAMEDLHAQIVRRQSTEDEVRKLNEELEERVRSRTAELEEMNRELEAFSYSVSHDLRGPLRHMDGFSRILQQEYSAQLPEQGRHYLKRICDGATHMSALVEDLLQLWRIGRQTPRLEAVSLRCIVEEAQEELRQEGEGREVSWLVEPLGEVEADPILLRQVVVNLLSNALKFTRPKPAARIEIGSQEENGETVVYVRDNGAGFDPRYADKLFGVFQRLHREDEFEGTGIGLATVQRIVRKHGGRVWAESQPGCGATFYFALPRPAKTQDATREFLGASA